MQMSIQKFIQQIIKNGQIARHTVKKSRKIDAKTAITTLTDAFLKRSLSPNIDHKAAIVRVVSRVLKNTSYDHHDFINALIVFFRQEDRQAS